MQTIFRWWTVWGMLWVASPAWAWNVTFCVDVNVNYVNAAGGDYWTDNAVHKAARWFRYDVTKLVAGTFVTVASGNLGTSNATKGCTGTLSLTGNDHRLIVYPEGVVGTNDFLHEVPGAVVFGTYNFAADTTVNEVISYADESYAQLAILAYALWEHDGGNSNESFRMDHDGCCSASASQIHLSATQAGKYIIAHEIGHSVIYKRAIGIPEVALAGGPENCDGGIGMLVKRHQTNAISEGSATWYALITWNEKDEGDCDYRTGDADFNLNGATDVAAGTKVDCAGDPEPAGSLTDGRHWLSDLVTGTNALGCTGTLTDRSTSYDWFHYLWNLHAYGAGAAGDGLTANQIIDIFVEADPTTWDADGGGVVADDPWPRWDAAARALSQAIEDAHDAQLDQVDH
ncbi:MAG: hypothetical protein ABMA64_30620 [Myxococcota bacterium]